jgi:hypothetical protein
VLLGTYGDTPLEELPDDKVSAFYAARVRYQKEYPGSFAAEKGHDDFSESNSYARLHFLAALAVEEANQEVAPKVAENHRQNLQSNIDAAVKRKQQMSAWEDGRRSTSAGTNAGDLRYQARQYGVVHKALWRTTAVFALLQMLAAVVLLALGTRWGSLASLVGITTTGQLLATVFVTWGTLLAYSGPAMLLIWLVFDSYRHPALISVAGMVVICLCLCASTSASALWGYLVVSLALLPLCPMIRYAFDSSARKRLLRRANAPDLEA